METKENLESGFIIKSILLLDSNFSRLHTIEFENDKVTTEVNVEIDVQVNNNIVGVGETLTYKQIVNNIEQVNCKIKMVGVFERVGNSELDLENFGNVNGVAIIFPYIREHLSSLCLKAGLGLVILPPFNFTKKKTQ